MSRREMTKLVEADPAFHRCALARSAHLLTPQGLAVARNDLHRLLAMAYSQGVADAADVVALSRLHRKGRR